MLMGRLVKDPEVKELPEGKRVMNVKLAVGRGFQNSKGEYEKIGRASCRERVSA